MFEQIIRASIVVSLLVIAILCCYIAHLTNVNSELENELKVCQNNLAMERSLNSKLLKERDDETNECISKLQKENEKVLQAQEIIARINAKNVIKLGDTKCNVSLSEDNYILGKLNERNTR